MNHPSFSGRLGLQQRVLPLYRVAFFEALAASCRGGLSLFAGQPLPQEGITPAQNLRLAHYVAARNIHIFDPSSALYLCWQRGFLRWLKTWQPDALVVEANPRYLTTRLAVEWMHRHRRPVIGWGLGAPLPGGVIGALRRWERLSFLRNLDAIIAYSRRGAEEYVALGLPPERIFVAPNAAVSRLIKPPVARPLRFDGQPVLLFVGRLQARKRLDMLLYACAALPNDMRPRLLIVGDGPERQTLEALAQKVYPIAEFTGAKHGAELEPYFAAADLLVLPGTGGLAIQEAMSHGLPVIVARGDGTQDDLVRPANGWQIPPDDQEALRTALTEALSNPQRLRQMGAESYRIVAEEINIEKMVQVFIQVLQQLT